MMEGAPPKGQEFHSNCSHNHNSHVYCSASLSCSIPEAPVVLYWYCPTLYVGKLRGGSFLQGHIASKGESRIRSQVSLIPGPVGHSVATELTCDESPVC